MFCFFCEKRAGGILLVSIGLPGKARLSLTLRAPLNPFTRWFLVAVAIIVFSLFADFSRVLLQYSLATHVGAPMFSITQALRLMTEPFLRADSAYLIPAASIKAGTFLTLPG